MARRNALLLLAAAFLVALPLLLPRSRGAEFAGTDDAADALTSSVSPAYRRWARPLWQPPDGVEGGLFALQAGLGGVVLGYVLGRRAGRSTV